MSSEMALDDDDDDDDVCSTGSFIYINAFNSVSTTQDIDISALILELS